MADDSDRNSKKKDESISPLNKKQKLDSDIDDVRPLCKYGESCYQKNTFHLKKYRHPHRQENEKPSRGEDVPSQEGNVPLQEENAETGIPEKDGETKLPSSPRQCVEDQKDDQPPTPLDVRENIKRKFLMEMPEDFYSFWNFCSSVNQKAPRSALKELFGLELAGPFKLLNESECTAANKISYLNHRFYYDPPEFQCVLVGDVSATGYHIGYFRDSPLEMPVFVGSSVEAEGCAITQLGDNLFSSMGKLIGDKLKKADPFHKTKLMKFKKQLENWTKENNISMENVTMKERSKKIVAKTFYQCGIVVPVDKKSQVGYREIPESNANLKKICKKIMDSKDSAEQDANFDALQELVRYVQYANDELDYGMGLELGLDLLAFGGEVFHSTILHLLGVAYELLERPEFYTILKVHLASRKKICSEQQDSSD